MKFSSSVYAVLLGSAVALCLSGCDRQGTFEEAGESIDQQIDDASDAVKDATNGD